MYDVNDFVTGVWEGERSLSENKAALLSALDPSVRAIIKSLDYEELLKDFEESIWELFQDETPDGGIKIIHFGLREAADGCCVYVAGTKQREVPEFRDSECWDWITQNGGCLNLPILNRLWDRLCGTREEEWEVVLSVFMILLKAYLDEKGESFLETSGLSRVRVSVGFDDGDIYETDLPKA